MALTRITSAGIADSTVLATDVADGAVTTAKLDSSAVTTAKIANSAVTSAKIDSTGSFSVAELTITGTSGLQVPVGTEAQRPSSPTNGLLRFNTTAGKLEVYNTAKVKWEAAGGGGGAASAGMAYFASSF